MYNIEELEVLLEQIKFPPYNGFPDIELYMDQVIDFLSRSRTNLRDDDRISSAMVNNYIKAEILPRARGKKYSREHLAYLAVIVRIKQVLSVKDTGELIRFNKLDKTDEEFFDSFRESVEAAAEQIINDVASSDKHPTDIVMELAVQSYINKIACEYLIDHISDDYWKYPERIESPVNHSHKDKDDKHSGEKGEKDERRGKDKH